MEHTKFVHLHTHSEYSLLDGAAKVEALLERAHKLKMPALAITDHGNMFGAIEFYKYAYKIGVKPIIGCELYIAPASRFDRNAQQGAVTNYHGVCLVKNEEGYKNLMKLVSIGYTEGFYYKPRIDKEVLSQYSKGLIFMSGCIKGEISSLILHGQDNDARIVAREYQKMFGEGNFYLELHSHGLREEAVVNQHLLGMSIDLGIPLAAANDIHYLLKEDASAHDVLLCIQTNKHVADTDRLRFSSNEFYLKTYEEMNELFSQFPEAISNTIEIAKKCNLELEFGHIHIPHYHTPEDIPLNDYLRQLCMERLEERYPGIVNIDEPSPDDVPQASSLKKDNEILNRLNHELQIISQMRYPGYFLIVWDLINYAKQKGIPVGPGRGSAAGSIVSYLLGITDIDPIRYNLLFERFLNPERVSMPDIDIDFCYERRDEVIEYVTSKYGKDRVAQIITFGSMLAKGVIRDVGRALDIPYGEVDKIAKLIPNELQITLTESIKRVPELAQIYEEGGIKQRLIETALKLEGLVRHASTHAAGVVIAGSPLTEFAPLYCDQKSPGIITQYAKDEIESIGLLKMDFLGLKTLTLIRNIITILKEKKGIDIDISKIPLDDTKTFQLLCVGETIGVFQLESSGMRELTRKLQPDVFEDLIALVALYRPGPLNSGMVDEFVQSKHGKKIKYLHPKLKHILEETYGVMVYQEQVMNIAVVLGGFSLAQADELRRAMSKKVPEKMEKMKKLFVEGASNNGLFPEMATKIFDLMAKFAEYGFNKSHSAAYALIAYQTAYLKAHFPVEFMAALLTAELGNIDKISFYIAECKRMGIAVLPPDVNQSDLSFTPIKESIRFGLNGIKNVGSIAILSIIKAREVEPFKSIYDFCKRVDSRTVNKRVIESLINCGGFDSIGAKRSQLAQVVDDAIKVGSQKVSKAMSLFEMFGQDKNMNEEYEKLPDIPEWPENALLKLEKELLGIYLTSHPLNQYEQEFKRYTTCTISGLKEQKDGEIVVIGGMISQLKKIITKKSEKQMAFITLEDMDDSIEVIFFPKVFESAASQIALDEIVLIKGKLEIGEDKCKILAEEIIEPSQAATLATSLHVRLKDNLDDSCLNLLKETLLRFKGVKPVYLHMPDEDENETMILTGHNLRVTPSEELVDQIEIVTGKDAAWFGYNGIKEKM
ncbi:DNA polymerase III subunit alpha [Candidatus Desantisbacteria bacterium]|nr:DNA polymerase III subunit alpha [Candidatus Desantisbacteria bacterium]